MKLRTLAPLGLSAASALLLGGLALVAVSQASAEGTQASPPQGAAASTPRSGPPAGVPGLTLIDTSTPFNHDHHLDAKRMGKALGCASCHEMVASDGTCPKQEVRFPKHEACTGCHAANFYTMPLTICVNCHQSAQFAKANPLRELGRFVTPQKSEFSHKSHLQAARDTDCTSCHAVRKGGEVMGHPSHPNCCQCHAGGAPGIAGKVAEPTMNKCGECHNEARSVGRAPSKIHGFSHKDHREDPRTGTTTSCQSCHVNMVTAATLRTIPVPPMATCVGCHDGSDPTQPHPQNPGQRGTGAFHFSTCMGCHVAGKIAGMALPPSHPPAPAPAPAPIVPSSSTSGAAP